MPALPTFLRRLLTSLVVVAAVAGIVIAAREAETGETDPSSPSGVVEARLPPEGAVALGQDAVGLDLAPGWSGRLVIGGVVIPDDEVNCVECPAPDAGPDPLNRVIFRPGPDKVIEALPTGPLCAIAAVWRTEEGPVRTSDVRWCFRVGA